MKFFLVLILLLVSVNLLGSSETEARDALIQYVAIIILFIPAILASGRKNGKTVLLWTVFLWWTIIIPIVQLVRVIIDITNETVKCPYCKEKIKKDAVVCKHCQKNLTEQNK